MGDGSVLYGWRTRNLHRMGGQCQDLRKGDAIPCRGDAQDPGLQAACIEMCSSLYPGKPLEVPGMIMRGAYGTH